MRSYKKGLAKQDNWIVVFHMLVWYGVQSRKKNRCTLILQKSVGQAHQNFPGLHSQHLLLSGVNAKVTPFLEYQKKREDTVVAQLAN